MSSTSNLATAYTQIWSTCSTVVCNGDINTCWLTVLNCFLIVFIIHSLYSSPRNIVQQCQIKVPWRLNQNPGMSRLSVVHDISINFNRLVRTMHWYLHWLLKHFRRKIRRWYHQTVTRCGCISFSTMTCGIPVPLMWHRHGKSVHSLKRRFLIKFIVHHSFSTKLSSDQVAKCIRFRWPMVLSCCSNWASCGHMAKTKNFHQ